jgi:N-acyl-D-amino-acid deacylase
LLAAVDEIIESAEASATTGIVSHMKSLGPDAWGLVRACATRIEAARDRGVAVFADQYPYEASATSLGGSWRRLRATGRCSACRWHCGA